MNLIRLLSLLASCSMLPAFACGGDPPVETTTSAQPLTPGPITNGAPGGGLGFCCIRSDGHRWTVGDVDPVTGLVMTTQSQVNGACASGHLPIRYPGSC